MSTLKKILIVPFFGDLPEWFDKYEAPKGYTLLLDVDLNKFKERVKSKLGIEYPGVYGSPKVWDYRCALGKLYEEEIKGYDYWGHVDLDVVFGDMDKFLPDHELAPLDIYSGHIEYMCGCFSLYRNVPKVNNLFSEDPKWKENMTGAEPTGWVEYGYSRLVEKSGLWYAYTFNQGNPWDRTPELKKEDGKLYQKIMDEWREIMFFHFRHSKKWPL